jgi:hypothetical protein
VNNNQLWESLKEKLQSSPVDRAAWRWRAPSGSLKKAPTFSSRAGGARVWRRPYPIRISIELRPAARPVTRQEGDPAGFRLPGGVRVGLGVSQVVAAFVATLPGPPIVRSRTHGQLTVAPPRRFLCFLPSRTGTDRSARPWRSCAGTPPCGRPRRARGAA